MLYNRTELLYLFYDIESDNFPTNSAECSIFSKHVKVASAVHCSLMKHAKLSQSILVTNVQIICLADKATAVNQTGPQLSFQFRVVSSGFREKNNSLQGSLFKLFLNTDLKAGNPAVL